MNLRKIATEIADNIKRYGVGETFRWFTLKALHRLVRMRCMIVVAIEKIPPEAMKLDPRFRAGFLKAEELLRFIGSPGWDDPEFGLSQQALVKSEREGKQWYALTDGEDKLASIMWFSCVPTVNRSAVFFDSDWVYGGGGFTHPDYRGMRLIWSGQARAVNEFKKLGKKGVVADVDGRNLPMLKGTYRSGYKPIGFGCFFEIFGKELIWNGPRRRGYGFRYAQPAELSSPALSHEAKAAETAG